MLDTSLCIMHFYLNNEYITHHYTDMRKLRALDQQLHNIAHDVSPWLMTIRVVVVSPKIASSKCCHRRGGLRRCLMNPSMSISGTGFGYHLGFESSTLGPTDWVNLTKLIPLLGTKLLVQTIHPVSMAENIPIHPPFTKITKAYTVSLSHVPMNQPDLIFELCG